MFFCTIYPIVLLAPHRHSGVGTIQTYNRVDNNERFGRSLTCSHKKKITNMKKTAQFQMYKNIFHVNFILLVCFLFVCVCLSSCLLLNFALSACSSNFDKLFAYGKVFENFVFTVTRIFFKSDPGVRSEPQAFKFKVLQF